MEKIIIIILLFFASESFAAYSPTKKEAEYYSKFPKIKVLQTVYFAHKWSDIGRYKRVSINKKRIGEYVALNFLPGGSIIMIPELFRTSKFEVADTFGGTGFGKFKGKKYWKVDVLRNKGEYIDDFDFPMEMYIVKYNKNGPVKNKAVKQNCINIYNEVIKPFEDKQVKLPPK